MDAVATAQTCSPEHRQTIVVYTEVRSSSEIHDTTAAAHVMTGSRYCCAPHLPQAAAFTKYSRGHPLSGIRRQTVTSTVKSVKSHARFLCVIHRRRNRGGGATAPSTIPPPTCRQGGRQTVSNAPSLRRLSGMMPASTEKNMTYIGENV